MIKKNVGRPLKVDYKIMGKLEDALRNRSTVSEACKYAGISRDTYYRYLITQDVFAFRMQSARKNKTSLASIFF